MTAVRTLPPPPSPASAGGREPRSGAGDRGSVTGWLAVGAAAIGAGLLGARALGHQVGPCALRSHTGVPCPGCGLTRLAVHVTEGRLGTAATGDLPGLLLLLAVAVVAVAQVAALRGRSLPWLRGPALPLVLGGLLAAHWALTAVTGGLPSLR